MEQMIFKDLPPSPPPTQHTKRIGGETRRGLKFVWAYKIFIYKTGNIEQKLTTLFKQLVPSESRRLSILCDVLAADSEVVHANRLYKPKKKEVSKKNKTITYLTMHQETARQKQRKQ